MVYERLNKSESWTSDMVNSANSENIVSVMKRKKIPPVVVRLLAEQAKTLQNEKIKAVEAEGKKSPYDPTRSPRADYDMAQAISPSPTVAGAD